jgi:hypothetical protein
MKHLIKALLLSLLMLALLLPALSGCMLLPTDEPPAGEPPTEEPDGDNTPPAQDPLADFASRNEKQQALYILRNDLFNERKMASVTMEMQMTFSGNYLGFAMTGSSSTTLKAIQKSANNDLFFCTETDTSFLLSGSGVNERFTSHTHEGYANGKMFAYGVDSSVGKSYALYSELTAEEFLAHEEEMEEDSTLNDIDERSCSSITCKKTADGYEASFSGFTAQGMEALYDLTASISTLFEQEVQDVQLTICVDDALTPRSLALEMLFEGGEDAPQIAMQIAYTDVGSTKPYTVDFTGYRKVTDLRVLDQVERAVEKTDALEVLSFSHKSQITAEVSKGSFQNSTCETDLYIDERNDALYFTLNENNNGVYGNYTYEDGVFSGEGYYQPLTLAQARALLAVYCDTFSLEPWRVKECKYTADGELCVVFDDPDTAPFADLLASYEVTACKNAEATLTVRLKSSGLLHRFEYVLLADVEPSYSATPLGICYRVTCKNYSTATR